MAEDSIITLAMITQKLWVWTLPLLVWFGTMGNCLCIFASLRTEMRNMLSRYYFFAWTIANEALIISWALVWIFQLTDFQWNDSSGCHIITYTSTLCRFLSSYFAVALIAERFISVRYPEHRRATSLLANPNKIIAAITIWGLLHSTLFLWLVDSKCGINKGYESWIIALAIVNLIIVELVPALLIILMSIKIFIKTRISVAAASILSNPTTNGTANVSANRQITNINVAKQIKLTNMLAVIAVVSVCLDLPARIVVRLFTLQPNWIRTALMIAYNILALFSRASFGINFFIWWAVDHDYRQAAYDTFHCRPRINPTSLQTNTHGNSRCNAPILTTSSGNATALQDTTTVLEMSFNVNAQASDNTNDENSKTSQHQSH